MRYCDPFVGHWLRCLPILGYHGAQKHKEAAQVSDMLVCPFDGVEILVVAVVLSFPTSFCVCWHISRRRLKVHRTAFTLMEELFLWALFKVFLCSELRLIRYRSPAPGDPQPLGDFGSSRQNDYLFFQPLIFRPVYFSSWGHNIRKELLVHMYFLSWSAPNIVSVMTKLVRRWNSKKW